MSAPAFPSLAAASPGWVYDPDWDTVRLSARGAVSPNAHFDVEVTATVCGHLPMSESWRALALLASAVLWAAVGG